jgi:electron transfer flavoprotein alpha subunit
MMRWSTHGAALTTVCEQLPPALLLFGATQGAREVAPRSAARLGAAFVHNGWIENQNGHLTIIEGSGETAAVLDEIEFPVVVTIPPGRYALARGDDEAEVEVVNVAGAVDRFERVDDDETVPSEQAALVLAREEDGATQLAAARSLATALHGAAQARAAGVTPVVISLGAPVYEGLAEVRVALGPSASSRADAHYAIEGDAAELASKIAAALAQAPTSGGKS